MIKKTTLENVDSTVPTSDNVRIKIQLNKTLCRSMNKALERAML